jgi:hypothetical protein
MIEDWKTALQSDTQQVISDDLIFCKENIPILQNMLENFTVEHDEQLCLDCNSKKQSQMEVE